MKARLASNIALAIGAMLLLSGCYIVKPRTIVAYDDECEIGFRKMILTVEQVGTLPGYCNGSGCGEAVVLGLIATSASAVVSGSIVLVGNTIFWMEKRGRCDEKEEVLPVLVPPKPEAS